MQETEEVEALVLAMKYADKKLDESLFG